MDAVISGSVPAPGPELDGYMAYKGGQSFLFFLASSRPQAAFSKFLARFKATKNVERSMKEVYGKTIEELGEEWTTELKRLYWPEIGRRRDPSKNGTALTAHFKNRDNFNLRPRISPDGTKVAYFSDLRDYTRIIITDRSGKILQEVSESGYAGTFEMFHPFRSGMCWSPTGDRLAFVTSDNGKDELRIIDVKKKTLVCTFSPDLSSVYSPDWSPAGDDIVFCGIDKGYSDLFLFNVNTRACTRLTNNIRQETDPRFTRDGTSVVFSQNDTSGSAERTLQGTGDNFTQLWRLDLSGLHATQLTHAAGNKKSPCFSPGGDTVCYVSDRNGIDNLYIAPLRAPDSTRAVTDVIGGCSSPDWAKDSSVLVYCLFQKGGWDIWQMRDPLKKQLDSLPQKTKWVEFCEDTAAVFFSPVTIEEKAAAEKKNKTPPAAASAQPQAEKKSIAVDSVKHPESIDTSKNAGTTPAALAGKDTVKAEKAKEEKPALDAGKAASIKPVALSFDTIQPRPYRLKFAPDLIALGVGTNNYYGYGVSGQWMAVFSDLMGNHQIAVMGDVQGNVVDYAHIFASYLNLEYKVNFGIGAFYNREYTSADIFGDSLYFDTDGGFLFLLRYPFSMYSRLDLQGYYENLYRYPYLNQIDDNGNLVTDTTRAAKTVNIFIPSLSYVYDNILWGITGPLNGMRGQARVQVSPPLPSLEASFASVDLDIRKYLHLFKRFVWANRVALGASVPLRKNDASNRRYFLGGDENWFLYGINDYNSKGYQENINNFFYSDIVVPFRGWRYLDIVGTKFALINTEFRFPFLRELTLAWPLPLSIRYVTGAVFADAGNAWYHDEEFPDVPLPKKIYGGIGYGLRANLGIFILRYDRGWKTDWNTFFGPDKTYFSLGAEF
jgi:Tol biopolymer transport system component